MQIKKTRFRFELQENIQSSAILSTSSSSKYDECALTIAPNLPVTTYTNSEFILVVDCSESMSGQSIKKASECLELFIKSIPPKSYFNVYRFGSSYEMLFISSKEYTNHTAKEAIDLAKIFWPIKTAMDNFKFSP